MLKINLGVLLGTICFCHIQTTFAISEMKVPLIKIPDTFSTYK